MKEVSVLGMLLMLALPELMYDTDKEPLYAAQYRRKSAGMFAS